MGKDTLSNVTPKITKITGKMGEDTVMRGVEYIVKCDTEDNKVNRENG